MKKTKIIMLIVIIIGSILLIANYSNAATVTSEKIVTSTNGSVDYVIKNLELEDGASYQWAIEKSKEAEITNWYDVTAPEYSTGNIRITVSSGNKNQLAILKTTDIAYITVKKVGEKTNILEDYKVDLTLPLLKSFTVNRSTWYESSLTITTPAYEISSAYDIKASNISFKWEKITDADIVNTYIDNNHDLSGLKLKGKESFPSLSDTSWKSVHQKYSTIYPNEGEILNNEKPAQNGLYYLWLKGSSDDTKTIYGQVILEIGKVEKINEDSNDKDNSNNKDNNGNSNIGDNNNEKNDNQQILDNKNTNTSTTGKDTTTAQGILPKTGIGFGLVVIIISLLGIGVFTYSKYNNLKDVK